MLACVVGLAAVSCEKRVIDVNPAGAERVVVPESLSLTVGQAGTFAVRYLPEDAKDVRITELRSSDPAVLSVSHEGLAVSYEALSAGRSDVFIRLGDVFGQVAVTVSAADEPSGPVVSKGGYTVEVSPGLRTVTELLEAAALKVSIVEGDENGNYQVSYSVDGGEPATVRGLFVGDSRTFALDEGLALGQHAYSVVVGEEKGLTSEETFAGTFWVKGPSLTSASVRFVSDFDADFELSAGEGVSLVSGEQGWALFSYKPASTYVVRNYEIPSFLQLDFNAASEDGDSYKVPFLVLSPGEGQMSVSFDNGDESYVVSGRVDGKSGRPLGVRDYSVPENLQIAMDGGSQTYTFVTVPEHAFRPEITAMASDNPDIVSVGWRDLTATFTPHYKGTAKITMTLSGITKEFTVEVTGNVVTDFSVPEGLEIVMGESAVYDLQVTPQGALDAAVGSASSSDVSVLRVQADGLRLTLTGVKKGEVTVSVTVGHITKEFPVTVLSDEVSDFRVPSNFQLALGGGAQSYTFEVTPAHPSNGEIVSATSSDESVVKVSHAGLTATFTPVYTGSSNITVVIGSVTKTFPVQVVGDVVTDFTVPQDFELEMGATADYTVEVTPRGALDAEVVSLSSSDESVLRVSSNGLRLTMIAGTTGTARVSLTVGKVSKSFPVTVKGRYVQEFDTPSNYSVEMGSSKIYTFVPKPEGSLDAELKAVTSSDESILKVEAAGGFGVLFSGVYPGTATVSVTIGSITRTFPVTVTGTVVTDFSVPQTLVVERGESTTYELVTSPAGAVDATVRECSSSDDGVVSIAADGLRLSFTGISRGNATATVTVGRVTKSFPVSVTPRAVKDFSVPVGCSFEMLTDYRFAPVFTPSDADDTRITSASSSDVNVLTVTHTDSEVVLHGITEGTATVSMTAGGVSKSFPVTVKGRYVKDYSIPQNMTMEIGGSKTYTFVPTQEGCLDAEVRSIRSSDDSILSVSADGLTATFTANYIGSVTVYVTVGGVDRVFPVTVTGTVVTGVDIPVNLLNGTLGMGERREVTLIPTPVGAYDAGTLSVVARDPSVVSVEDLGNYRYAFTGVGFGTASFEVSAGRYSTTFNVKVPETVSVSAGSAQVAWQEEVVLTVSGVNAGWGWDGIGDAFSNDHTYGKPRTSVTVSGNTITLRNVMYSTSDCTGKIVVTTPVTGARAEYEFTLKGASGKATYEVTRSTDAASHPVVTLTVRNASNSQTVTFSSMDFYYYSGLAQGQAFMTYGPDYYVNQLNGARPATLYVGSQVVGRLAHVVPASGASKKVDMFSVYTESWTLTGYTEDVSRYSNGLGLTGRISGAGMTGDTIFQLNN